MLDHPAIFLPVFGGSKAGVFLKCPAEMGEVIKADFFNDLRDRQFSVSQDHGSQIDPQARQVFDYCIPGFLGKPFGQGRSVDMKDFGQFADGDWFPVVDMQIVDYFFYLRRDVIEDHLAGFFLCGKDAFHQKKQFKKT